MPGRRKPGWQLWACRHHAPIQLKGFAAVVTVKMVVMGFARYLIPGGLAG